MRQRQLATLRSPAMPPAAMESMGPAQAAAGASTPPWRDCAGPGESRTTGVHRVRSGWPRDAGDRAGSEQRVHGWRTPRATSRARPNADAQQAARRSTKRRMAGLGDMPAARNRSCCSRQECDPGHDRAGTTDPKTGVVRPLTASSRRRVRGLRRDRQACRRAPCTEAGPSTTNDVRIGQQPEATRQNEGNKRKLDKFEETLAAQHRQRRRGERLG